VFRLLSEYYEERARLWREVLGNLAYPVFLLHFAIFILPLPALFASWDFNAYLMKTLGVLLPLYLLIGISIFASQSTHGESWRRLMERLLGAVPLLGGARRKLALSRLAAALEALISAGVNIIEAWWLAASASGSPALMREVSTWKPHLDDGATPAKLLRNNPRVFPELFANLYAGGEVSGQLDDVLKRLHRLYKEEGSRQMQVVAQWVPRFIYLVVALFIAWKIIAFYKSYFDMVRDAGGF
jgi:type II secretory pathway component PulF